LCIGEREAILTISLEQEKPMTGFWLRWMTAWCWCVIAFGVVLLGSAVEPVREPSLLFLDLVFWPVDGQPKLLSREAVFATSITGALTIGWGLLMRALVSDPTLARNPSVWRHMTVALAVWFVTDSVASILTGAWVNAISNSLIIALAILPIIRSGVLGVECFSARVADSGAEGAHGGQ